MNPLPVTFYFFMVGEELPFRVVYSPGHVIPKINEEIVFSSPTLTNPHKELREKYRVLTVTHLYGVLGGKWNDPSTVNIEVRKLS